MEPVLASLIHHLKYRGRRRVADRLGRLMARVVLSDPGFRACDGLVPVPLRPEKELERGYNPAELLGDRVSSIVGIPLLDGILLKTRKTRSQTEIKPAERISNPSGSFGVLDHGEVAGKCLLIIDDVMTSGSTLAAAAGALLAAGSCGVFALTAARTPSRGYSCKDPSV
jgi:ComF family protein